MRTLRVLLFLVLFVAAGAGVLAVAAWWEENYFAAAGPALNPETIVIAPGSGLGAIAKTLEEAGVIENALLFRVGVVRRRHTAQLKAGEYAFPAHASEGQIVDMMIARKVVEHRITITEGLTSDAAVALVKADPVLTGDVPTVPEGSLLPETYLFERGTTRAELIARMHRAQTRLLVQLWPGRKPDLPLMTEDDALKLASIVEKETAVPAERPRIAAVFLNRLKMGMKLESDPTIIYGLTKGVPLGHPLRQSELAMPNPYSTYQIEGLPPTPISNPGKDAIAAVLNPAQSEELYFVADGSGGHVFAKTIAEHQKNVAQWRRLQQAQTQGADPQASRLR